MKKLKRIIILLVVTLGIWLLPNGNVKALSQEEAGKYIASFAKNFYNSSNRDLVWYCLSHRVESFDNNLIEDHLHLDCVAWAAYVVENSLHLGVFRGNYGPACPWPQDSDPAASPYFEVIAGPMQEEEIVNVAKPRRYFGK